jgi:hypothetical protein
MWGIKSMTSLRIVFAAAAGAIAGLLGYGLAPFHAMWWGIGAAAIAILVVGVSGALFLNEEDRDPTIRPPNLPHDDNR